MAIPIAGTVSPVIIHFVIQLHFLTAAATSAACVQRVIGQNTRCASCER